MKFEERIQELETKIQSSYTEGVTLDQAEKLAGEFLHAQMLVSGRLSTIDLSARMRKSGLKAVKAAVYLDTCSKADKKPTESALEHMINVNELVAKEQDGLDTEEAARDNLTRLYNIFQAAHVHFRQMSKGQFGG